MVHRTAACSESR